MAGGTYEKTIGVLWGAILLRESIGVGTIGGGAIVLIGTGLVTGLLSWPARHPIRSSSSQGGWDHYEI